MQLTHPWYVGGNRKQYVISCRGAVGSFLLVILTTSWRVHWPVLEGCYYQIPSRLLGLCLEVRQNINEMVQLHVGLLRICLETSVSEQSGATFLTQTFCVGQTQF